MIRMKRLSPLLLGLLLLGIFLIGTPPSYAAIMQSTAPQHYGTLNGVMADGEWDDAYQNHIVAYNPDFLSAWVIFDIYAKNNEGLLYLCIEVSPIHVELGVLQLMFDEENAGTWNASDYNDGVCFRFNTTWHRAYDGYCMENQTGIIFVVEDQEDSESLYAMTYDAESETFTIELQLRLQQTNTTSEGLEDLQPGVGATMGFALRYDDYYNILHDKYEYPAGTCSNHSTVPFQLATAGSEGVGSPWTFVYLLVSCGLLVIVIEALRRPQRRINL